MSLQSVSFQRARQGTVLAASGTGLQVTASSGMTVAIAAGTYFLGGKTIVYAGANVTADTADPTNSRYDVVVLDINGTASIVKGTAAASPTVPLYKDDVMPVAILVITANDATIASGDIIDVRDLAGISADGTTISVSAAGVLSVLPAGLTSSFDPVVASGQGNVSIVGNGTAQNVFTDTFTQNDGDIIEIICRYRIDNTAGVDTPDLVLKLGSTNLNTSTLTSGGADAYRMTRAIYMYSATAGQGWGFVEQIGNSGATGTAAQTIAKNDVDSWTNTGASITLTADPAAATTTRVRYAYMVRRHVPGV